MGESLFLQPMKSWLQKRRARKTEQAQPETTAEEGPTVSTRDIFAPKVPAQTVADDEARGGTAPHQTSDRAGMDADQLDQDLALNVFDRRSAASQEETEERGSGTDEVPDPTHDGRVEASAEGDTWQGAGATSHREGPETPPTRIRRVTLPDSGEEEDSLPVAVKGIFQKEGSAIQQPQIQPRTRPGSGEVLDSLPVSVKDVFRKKVVTNPQVRALLQRQGSVEARELSEQLQEFARSLEAEEDGE